MPDYISDAEATVREITDALSDEHFDEYTPAERREMRKRRAAASGILDRLDAERARRQAARS
jgi:hypothetical protein